MSAPALLTDAEKKFLLALARDTIVNAFLSTPYEATAPYTENLQKKYGVFVTLHYHKELRGCIGYPVAYHPLQKAVVEMALSAAFNDPRFMPIVEEELPELEIEISVLSPLEEIDSVDKIQVGKHGLIIEKDNHRGLLLPQVATEQNWNRSKFLEHICLKAGLSINAWMDKTAKLFIFSAEIFCESDFK